MDRVGVVEKPNVAFADFVLADRFEKNEAKPCYLGDEREVAARRGRAAPTFCTR